ncbi:MAG: hypothetical protein AB7T49_14680 [Oligoflexales bacterium]
MTSITEEAFELETFQHEEMARYHHEPFWTLVQYFSAFYTELNLKSFLDITSGGYLLRIERTDRAHAFLEVLLELLGHSKQMEDGERILLADNFITRRGINIAAFILETCDSQPVGLEQELQSKIEVMEFEFDTILHGFKDRIDNSEEHRVRMFNVLANLCLDLWTEEEDE